MLKKIILLSCLLFGSISFLQAIEPYQIPKAELAEVSYNKSWLEKAPTSNEARFELAMSYAYTGQIEKGWFTLKELPKSYATVVLEKYGRLLKSDPTEWKHSFKIAFGYYFQKDRKKAIASFQAVLEIDPKNVWAMGFISLINGEQGEVDAAIKICQEALAIEPGAAAIHFLLAEGYRKKGEYMKFLKEMMIAGRLKADI